VVVGATVAVAVAREVVPASIVVCPCSVGGACEVAMSSVSFGPRITSRTPISVISTVATATIARTAVVRVNVGNGASSTGGPSFVGGGPGGGGLSGGGGWAAGAGVISYGTWGPLTFATRSTISPRAPVWPTTLTPQFAQN
jgi:hypothetical protein